MAVLDFFDGLLNDFGLGLGLPDRALRQGFGWFNLAFVAAIVAAVTGVLGGPDLTSLPFAVGAVGLFVEVPARGFNSRLIGLALGLLASAGLFALVL